ncbi:MAG: hypothetical protein CSB49_04505, partial [Proteobacteria bacterium]
MPAELWTLKPADDARATALARELSLPIAMMRVLVARGVDELETVKAYLEPRLGQLTNPAAMAALSQALDRLMEAFEAGQHIGVFGDYDVDGVSSAAMVGDYLKRCGANVTLRVARRDEGYGFHVSQAQELIDQGVQLLVLTDTGTHDVEAVGHAQQVGVDVIALDHHRVGELSWPGFALVNPHRPDCAFPYKGLCAAGLAFYVMAALRRRLEARGREAVDPRENLDLVALATLADVAPLDGDNRILVAHGLRGLERTERPGLRELLRLCDLKGRRPTAEDVGWRLGPRFSLDLGLWTSFHDSGDAANPSSAAQVGFTVDGRFFLADWNQRLQPYLQAGLGGYVLSHDNLDFGSISGPGFQLGGGVDLYLTKSISLGGKLLYRGSFMDNSDESYRY